MIVNKSKKIIFFLTIFGGIVLTTVGIFYVLFQQEVKREKNVETTTQEQQVVKKQTEEIEEFPRVYKDESGIKWEVYGKYEAAKIAQNIVIRNSSTFQEIYRIPVDISSWIKQKLGFEVSGKIDYFVINDKLDKAYLFAGEPDEPEARSPLVFWNIFELDLNKENLGRLVLFKEEMSSFWKEKFRFSPNGKLMSHLSYNRSDNKCRLSTTIVIYDLIDRNKEYKIISPPLRTQDEGYIGFHKWNSNEEIEFTFFFNCNIPEIWQYNIITGEYKSI